MTTKQAVVIFALLAVPLMVGCPSDDARIAQMAVEQANRQAEQSKQTTELQQQVAAGARELVKADSEARRELVTLQRDVQSERAEVGQQRDSLEAERRSIAAARHRDPIIAQSVAACGAIVSCLLPLVLCWWLLRGPTAETENDTVGDLLIKDLVSDKPVLLPPRMNVPLLDHPEKLSTPDANQEV